MEEKLKEAIENLYQRFQRHQVTHPVQGSPISVKKAMQDALASMPLRKLTGDILSLYSFKAMTTWGDANDFKHFLPRILELQAFNPHQLLLAYPELLYQKIAFAGFDTWSIEEKQALADYESALWRYILEVYPSRSVTASDFLRMVSEVEPHLDDWQSRLKEQAALLHLVELIQYDYNLLRSGYNRRTHGREQPVVRWLLALARIERLEAAFFDHAYADVATEISRALDNLKLLAE